MSRPPARLPARLPVSALLGPGPTMVAGDPLGSVLMGSLLVWPGVRDPERGTARAVVRQVVPW